jgi:hypothetical protein
MASTIASLFGPSAEEIVYERQKEERDRQAQQYQTTLSGLRDTPGASTGYALGYQSGQGLGQAVGGLFGKSEELEDPRIAKALQMRQAFEGVTAADLSDPDKLTALAEKLQASGNPEAAFQLLDRARTLRTAMTPDLKSPGTRFQLADGTIVTGGYVDGMAVGVDQQGNRFSLGENYRVIGDASGAPTTAELTSTSSALEKIGADEWDDDGYKVQVASLAKSIQNADPSQSLGWYQAVEQAHLAIQQQNQMAQEEQKAQDASDFMQSIGMRPAGQGETFGVDDRGIGYIKNADGQIILRSNRVLTRSEIRNYLPEYEARLDALGANMGQGTPSSKLRPQGKIGDTYDTFGGVESRRPQTGKLRSQGTATAPRPQTTKMR